MKNTLVDIFRGGRMRALLPLCLLVYTHNFTDELISVPINRLVEYAVCARYQRGQITTTETGELECKTEQVQKHVIYLLGWFYAIDCLPGKLASLHPPWLLTRRGHFYGPFLGVYSR